MTTIRKRSRGVLGLLLLACALVVGTDGWPALPTPLGPAGPPGALRFAPASRVLVAPTGHGVVRPDAPLVVDFGREVTGKLQATVSAATPGTTLRFSFSESREFLQVGSDTDVYGQGDLAFQPSPAPVRYSAPYRRSFRWVLITVSAGGTATISQTALWFTGLLDPTPSGSFESSDPTLNAAWQANAYTAELVTTTGTASDCDGTWEPLGTALDVAACSWREETVTRPGADWTDYDLGFTTQLMPGGSAVRWAVRADPATQTQTGLELDAAADQLTIARQTGSYLQVSGGDVSLSQDGATWTNYTYSFDVRRPTNGHAAGWVFRAPDTQNGYMWQLGAGNGSQPGALRMHLLRNGQYTLLGTVPVTVQDDVWYHVQVVLDGSQIRTYIDGTLVDTRVDSTFPTGRVGFRENAGETGDFAHVRVTDSAGHQVLQDDFVTALRQWQFALGADRIVTTWTTLASARLPNPLALDTPYHVTTRVRGSQLEVLLDGRTLFNGPVAMAARGRVGFRAIGDDHYTVADVGVTTPSGQQLFADQFASTNPPALSCDRWEPIGQPPAPWTSPCVVAPIDGAKRDRAIGQPDLPIVDRTLAAVTGQDQFAANALAWTAPQSGTNPGGLIDGPAWWVWGLHDYFWSSGDRTTASRLYPSVVVALRDMTGLLDTDHLCVQPPGTIDWYWTVYDRQGESTYLSALTILALEKGAELAQDLGHPADATRWQAEIPPIRQAMLMHLWDDKAGAFVDSPTRRDLHPLDGNTLAILAGVVQGPQAERVLHFIQQHLWTPWGTRDVDGSYGSTYHDGTIWPAYITYELLARQEVGDGSGAEAVIRDTWGNMLANGPQSTAWEFASSQGNVVDGFDSLAHGWSTGAVWALTSGTLGVEPLAPGFSRFAVDPTPGDLLWARGRVPTPAGPIDVHWSHTAGDFRLAIAVPAGTTAEVGVPTFGQPIVVQLDGRAVWDSGRIHTSGVTQVGDRIVVQLGPGSHVLRATEPVN